MKYGHLNCIITLFLTSLFQICCVFGWSVVESGVTEHGRLENNFDMYLPR